MTRKREKKTNTKNNLFNIITIVASLIAIIVSIFSLLYTQKAYQLAENQDMERKTAIWTGEYNDKKEEISFTSSSEGITLQLANVYFPSELAENEWYINPPDYTLPTTVLESAVTEILDKKIKRKKDFYQVAEGDIPIVIDSHYIAAGSSASIKSQYNIRFIATFSEKEFQLPDVIIQGVWFDRHLPVNDDPREYIDNLWNTLPNIPLNQN